MAWQRIDDQFGVSQKVIRIPRRRRQHVVGLWTLAGNYAVRALTDGVLEAHELEELDARDSDVAELVRVGLWHQRGHDCAACPDAPVGGAVIHDFLIYNRSREQVLAEREAARVRMQRRRSGDGSEGVRANSDRTSDGSSPEVPEQFANPVPSRPSPVPSRPSDGQNSPDQSSPERNASDGTDEEISDIVKHRAGRSRIGNLPRMITLLRSVVGDLGTLSPGAAVELVDAIVARAKGGADAVGDVDGYVITAVRNSPDDVRWAYDRLDLGGVA